MAPIRILIVLAAGMGTSMFFWTLQSRLRWGLFGMVVGVLLAHCIIEIIYQADFKKLFSHKIQLMGCVAAGVLFSYPSAMIGMAMTVLSRKKERSHQQVWNFLLMKTS